MLVVDDSGVKDMGKEHAQNLIKVRNKIYDLDED